ncbi:ABC transporter ATP-binding protein/permease [Gammaproteobacteria bacterium]|nr:ABC transporter ATP-binding protein/permease [Gammaproteobacteria bacterium]
MLKALRPLEIFFYDRNLRMGVFGLQFLFLFSSLFELLGISSIGPLFYILTSGADSLGNENLLRVYEFLDPPSFRVFAIYLSAISIFAILLGGFFSISSFILLTRLATYGGVYLGNRLFSHYLTKDWVFFQSAKKSRIINEIYQETSRVTENILVPALMINKAAYLTFFILLLLLFINWQLTSIFFLTLASLYLVIFLFLKNGLNRNSEALTEAHEGRFKFLDETFLSIKEIHIWNNKKIFLDGYNSASIKWSKALRNNMQSANLPRFFIETFILLTISSLALVAYLNSSINISTLLPTYSIFIFSALKLLPALQQIYNGGATIAGNRFSLLNLHKVLNTNTFSSNKDIPISANIKSIELQNIDFSYEKNTFQLSDISFKADTGQIIGITGFSGGGKSTMLDILMGLLRPEQGMVLINGDPVDIYENLSWFRAISYLPQKINILNENIIENIKFSDDPEEDLQKLKIIEKQSNITEFFNSDNLESSLEVFPRNLSGGQVQRLGIARALYRDTNVLFFDEPTSALDNLNKHHFIQEMMKFKTDKIIFIVTHDVEVLKHTDQVLIMDNGSFEFSGNYENALLNSKILQKLLLEDA